MSDSEGKENANCAWGLGNNYNNQDKAMVVFMGLKLLIENSSFDIIVICEFELMIKGLRNLSNCKQPLIQRNYQRIANE